MKNKILSIFLIIALILVASPSYAKKKHVHRTFYVPFMPKAEKIHEAYRLVAHTGDYNIGVFRGQISYKTGDISGDKDVTDVIQTASLIRSDLIVLTNLGIKETVVKQKGNTVYHDTVIYETPEYIFGHFVDLSPLAGSSIMQAQKKPYFVASRISDSGSSLAILRDELKDLAKKTTLTNVFKGVPEEEILKSLVNYQGTNPQGKWIPIGKDRYIVSQEPTRILLNWWQELSQEFLKENLKILQSFEWQEISDYYEEMALYDGQVSSIPFYKIDYKDIPSNDEMFKMWESKKGILGKSKLPEHFTDYMNSASPGTWVLPGKTFVTCDPGLLVRWLYEIPRKEGYADIKVSRTVPTDFSPLKVDKEVYRYTALCGDPNILFAFSPFDGKAFNEKAGVKLLFPYTKKYEQSTPTKYDLRETGQSLPEEAKEYAKKAGSGFFEGNVENHLYGIGACFFIPTDKDSAIKVLNSSGMGSAVKSLGLSSVDKGSYKTYGSSVKEWK